MNQPVQAAMATPAPAGLNEALAVAVIVLAPDSLAVRWLNTAAEDLLGASRKRLLGSRLDQALSVGADWLDRLQEAARTDTPFSARELALGPTGTTPARQVDVSVTPWRSDDGELLLILECSAIDRQRRIARESALQTQERANRALLRGLAHEIRNPLAGLRGAAQLLERELDACLHEYTRVIVHETDRLRALVDRLVGPAAPLQLAPANIHEITEHVVRLLRAEAPAGVTLSTEYDPSLPSLQADRDRLVQALLNLGRNALQAVGDAGHVRIGTRALRRFTIGTTVHRLVAGVEVGDDGPGVPPELLDSLFQPMVSGRAQGSGLGLSIAQSLVRQHGGLIECDSEPGRTVFHVYLPMATEDD